ncbi:MAG: hypothetical protein WA814_12880 [Candidatus Baltobacteraceae bacterium]
MRNIELVFALSACGLASLTAEVPAPATAPSPAPSPAKLLRHLEYGFVVSGQPPTDAFNAADGGADAADSSGKPVAPEGSKGTIFVDVLSVAPDDALVVRIAERAQGDAQPRQPSTCRVYGNTSVVCPSTPAPSQAERVLLGYLGRQFIDGAPWDASGHWQRSEQAKQFDVAENFTLMDAGDGKKVVVQEVKKTQLHTAGLETQTSDVTIHYDRAMEVPDSIRDDVATDGKGGTSHASYQFTLQADSFTKAPSP